MAVMCGGAVVTGVCVLDMFAQQRQRMSAVKRRVFMILPGRATVALVERRHFTCVRTLPEPLWRRERMNVEGSTFEPKRANSTEVLLWLRGSAVESRAMGAEDGVCRARKIED
jgi:hypothetical protein